MTPSTWNDWLTLTAAFIVAVLATARFTRLMVFDDWPPAVWIRQKYRHAVNYGAWEGLVTCSFCFAPWPALANLAAAVATDLAPWWWLANLWFAGSYLASMVVARDEPDED